MAHKTRHANQKHFMIQLDHVEMLKLEKLLRILSEISRVEDLSGKENEWLSNALMLFAPELPPGTYPV